MISSNKLQRKLDKKLRRHQHILTKTTNINCTEIPTRNLGICNVGQINGLTEEIIYENFHIYGILDQVLLIPGKSCAFVSYKNVADAVQAFGSINARLNIGQDNKPVYLSYVESLPEHELHDGVMPPGLEIIENFVDETEEETLLSLCKFQDVGMKHRQVCHFGYEFRYDTNNVDKDKPLPTPIPEQCQGLWGRLNFPFAPDQLTVNRYEPGQGIPAHIDTHSAFEDPILSLSLNSDIVMEFKKANTTFKILLPRRSLAVIRGESRFAWTHAIIPRKFDFYYTPHGCKAFKRGLRISFTFRRVRPGACTCSYTAHCDSQRVTDFAPLKLEKEFVQDVYEDIAEHFSETRRKPWPKIASFVNGVRNGGLLVDVGCGNCKYFARNQHIFELGLDTSFRLLDVCRSRGFEVASATCLGLPLRDNTADAVISIAVIHHLSTKARRVQALKEITRVLRPGGEALIYVWSKQQIKDDEKSTYIKQDRKNWKGDGVSDTNAEFQVAGGVHLPIHTNRTDFKHSDVLVPWKLKKGQPDERTFLRFYHVFEEGELEALCGEVGGVIINDSYYDQGNYCIRFQKKHV